MVKLYAAFRDKGLAVVSVSLDEKKDKWIGSYTKRWVNMVTSF